MAHWNDVFPPPQTIRDYVSSLRQQCNEDFFRWPSEKMPFQKDLEVGLHLLPPGHMLRLCNRTEAPPLSSHPRVLYHGTSPAAVLQILASGLQPSWGHHMATVPVRQRSSLPEYGHNALLGRLAHLATPLAVVGTCTTIAGACEYPQRFTQWNYHDEDHPQCYPAQLLATDETYPMRGVIELLVPHECVQKIPLKIADEELQAWLDKKT